MRIWKIKKDIKIGEIIVRAIVISRFINRDPPPFLVFIGSLIEKFEDVVTMGRKNGR